VARDHLSERADESAARAFAIPPATFTPLREAWLGELPVIVVALEAVFYPTSGSGHLRLYRFDQAHGDDPALRPLTGLKLAPFTADYDVPDMAAYWLRAVAAATDWPSLIGIARHFRTTADRAREAGPGQ
jgi:hypothetical protein